MKKILLLLLFCTLIQRPQAQTTIQSLLSQPFPSSLCASTDGQNLAWILNDNGSRNVYSARGNNFNDVARVTGFEESDNGIDLSDICFTPSGKHVLFVRGNTPNGQGYAANPAQLQVETGRFLYLTDLEHGRDLRKIAAGYAPKIAPDGRSVAFLNAGQTWMASLVDTTLKPQPLFKVRGSVGSLRWSPDGRKLAFVNTRVDVDPKRIGLWGGSYGGYLTAHGLARRSDLFAAGVDIHGVHNWNKVIPTFNPGYDALKYPEIAKKAYESSPMFYAAGWKSPVLFIHGDDDRNVIFSETEDMIKVLRQRKVPYEQLIFPDEVHSFLLQRSWVKAYEATFEFLDRHLKR